MIEAREYEPGHASGWRPILRHHPLDRTVVANTLNELVKRNLIYNYQTALIDTIVLMHTHNPDSSGEHAVLVQLYGGLVRALQQNGGGTQDIADAAVIVRGIE